MAVVVVAVAVVAAVGAVVAAVAAVAAAAGVVVVVQYDCCSHLVLQHPGGLLELDVPLMPIAEPLAPGLVKDAPLPIQHVLLAEGAHRALRGAHRA